MLRGYRQVAQIEALIIHVHASCASPRAKEKYQQFGTGESYPRLSKRAKQGLGWRTGWVRKSVRKLEKVWLSRSRLQSDCVERNLSPL
jgi:hypothetical protein